MKKIISIILWMVLSLGFRVNAWSQNSPKIPSLPKVYASPMSLNFGNQNVGSTSEKTVTILNNGNSDLIMSSIVIAGGNPSDFSQTNDCTTIPKGNSCTMKVTFGPTSGGRKSGTVSISSNDPKKPAVNVKLSGNAICTYSVSSLSQQCDASGGTWSVNVTAPSGCSWTATSKAPWITITSGSSGSGTETVNYEVAANTGTRQRTGRMTITKQTFTVTQLGGGSKITITGTVLAPGGKLDAAQSKMFPDRNEIAAALPSEIMPGLVGVPNINVFVSPIDINGVPGSVIARGTTDQNGIFSLNVPGLSPYTIIQASAGNVPSQVGLPNSNVLNAPAVRNTLDVNPGSELVTRLIVTRLSAQNAGVILTNSEVSPLLTLINQIINANPTVVGSTIEETITNIQDEYAYLIDLAIGSIVNRTNGKWQTDCEVERELLKKLLDKYQSNITQALSNLINSGDIFPPLQLKVGETKTFESRPFMDLPFEISFCPPDCSCLSLPIGKLDVTLLSADIGKSFDVKNDDPKVPKVASVKASVTKQGTLAVTLTGLSAGNGTLTGSLMTSSIGIKVSLDIPLVCLGSVDDCFDDPEPPISLSLEQNVALIPIESPVEVIGNCPIPGIPSSPSPPDGATGVSTSLMLNWLPTSNTDSYDVYFGTSTNPTMVTNITNPSYSLSGLSYRTTYYWKIVAKNNCGNKTSGSVWSFTTGTAPCATPGTPSGPSPSNGATGISTSPTLGWSATAAMQYHISCYST